MIKSVLTIAGSDSGGGAGIQADIKTCCAFGVFSTTAITALTAQNTMGVEGIMDIPAEFVEKQIRTVVKDIKPDAVKVGMLGNPEIARRVADTIRDLQLTNIVLDPVLIASSGDSLNGDGNETVRVIMEELAPLATIITPNLPEGQHLLGIETDFEDPGPLAVRIFASCASPYILLKGGHGDSEDCVDYLVSRNESGKLVVEEYKAKRIATKNNHGTGCTLSTAIACGLAEGKTVEESITTAKDFISAALSGGQNQKLGNGAGPLDFFANFKR